MRTEGFLIITMEAPGTEQKRSNQADSGFTLVELMVGITLSLILMSATMSAFVFFSRTGLAMADYYEMEGDRNLVLQRLSCDVRQASNANWTDSRTVQLTVENQPVTYQFHQQKGTFTRQTTGEPTRILASDIVDFEFRAFDLSGSELSLSQNLSSAGEKTKMIQVCFSMEQNLAIGPETSAKVTSSRIILRNKLVP